MGVLKSFLDDYKICIILVLTSVDCLFLFKLKLSWFLEGLEIFGYILYILGIARPWILFKSIFAVFFLTPCWWGKGIFSITAYTVTFS